MKKVVSFAVLLSAMCFAGENVWGQCVHSAYYAPVYQAPVYQPVVAYRPVATYYAPPAPVVVPTAYYTTRYRPFLGGYVTRVNYGYAPAYHYGW